jgi:hypothetical protein
VAPYNFGNQENSPQDIDMENRPPIQTTRRTLIMLQKKASVAKQNHKINSVAKTNNPLLGQRYPQIKGPD